MGDIFPGCRANFNWLVRHFFDKDPEPGTPPDQDILNWILLEARSWSVPEIRPRAKALHRKLSAEVLNLLRPIEPIMIEIQADCPDSKAAIAFARRIVEALKAFVQTNSEPEPESAAGDEAQQPSHSDQLGQPGESGTDADIASDIKSLLTKTARELPAGLGQKLEAILTEAKAAGSEGALLRVAQVCPREADELLPSVLIETRTITTTLQRRLQSLLQAATLKPVRRGHRGRLDNGALHKLFINDPKLFRHSGVRTGLDSAVHLLIDASGSMTGQMKFVSTTAYCLSEALAKVPGLSLGATVFPGAPTRRGHSRDQSWETVAPILKHSQPLHRKFHLAAEGSTPMGEAIWWALQEMSTLKQNRKIIFILTDGEPDYIDNTKTAIAEAQRLGYEIYGLGLDSDSVKGLLPGRSAVIKQLADLPGAMFGLLGSAITRKEKS